jgi:magnesium transporter
VAVALLAGIGLGVTVSALFGLFLPISLRLVKLDPKVAAGPIALASADVATLFAYLGFAHWLLS